MQPPPRKAKVYQEVRTLHSEQLARLQAKHQLESDLLEDIRTFCKQRAAIEKEYSQALQKLTAQYMKKEWAFGQTDSKTDSWTIFCAWHLLLEGTMSAAQTRQKISEMFRCEISDAARSVRAAKEQQLKKCSDQLQEAQADLAVTVKELHKTRSKYQDMGRAALQARERASEAETRNSKRSSGLFQFKGSLQKANAKLSARLVECNARVRQARNDYILCLAAANAHQEHYYGVRIPNIMQTLDGDVYERFSEYFKVFGQTELEACCHTQEAFTTLLPAADKVSRESSHQIFLRDTPCITEVKPFIFQPADSDPVSNLEGPEEGIEGLEVENWLEKEARKWASRTARSHKQLVHSQRVLSDLEEQLSQSQLVETPHQSMETKLVEAQNNRHKAETEKLRAEACLAVLEQAGVAVQDWLSSAMSRANEELEREQHSNESRLSNGELSPTNSFTLDTFDDFDGRAFDDSSSSPTSTWRHYPQKCKVFYEYRANQPDELTIDKDDILEVIEDGDMEDWVKARDAAGNVGYVPEKYLQFPEPGGLTMSPSADGLSHSSCNSIEPEIALPSPPAEDFGVCLARALYDYNGQTNEELSFSEGAVLRILQKGTGGVDDGFWHGEFNGRVGVFPSIMVEELSGSGIVGAAAFGQSSSPLPSCDRWGSSRGMSPMSGMMAHSSKVTSSVTSHSGSSSPQLQGDSGRSGRPSSIFLGVDNGSRQAHSSEPDKSPVLRPVRVAPPPPPSKKCASQNDHLQFTLV
uniref:F-BAR and double SH3 domains protein 2 isoform X2 n=1 Tax=Myxine glutinosa TaxID=7769 RepID=UPI00358EA2C1